MQRSEIRAACIPKFATKPLSTYPQKMSPQFPLNRRLTRLRDNSGHFQEEKGFMSFPEIEPLSYSLVTLAIKLSHLQVLSDGQKLKEPK